MLDLGIELTPPVAGLVPRRGEPALFEHPNHDRRGGRDGAGRVVATGSRLPIDALAGVYAGLGFDVLGNETFGDLVIARIVEPASLLDSGRVLTDLGTAPTSYSTMKRTLMRVKTAQYRDQIATACFAHATTAGDVSLCLYDVTTLYFEAENEDTLRTVGYS